MTNNRPSATRRGYGETWRRYRRWYLDQHPVCKLCGKGATEVDHIRPLAHGGAKYELDNLQSLCKSCHSRKTSAEKTGRQPRLGCDVNGLPVEG